MEWGKNKLFLYSSLILSAAVTFVSISGILISDTYLRETENWKVQGVAQDMIDLFFIVPILVISGIYSYFKKIIPIFILVGTLLFLVYTFVIYCFSVHFNFLFPVYCFVFGLSLYSFIYFCNWTFNNSKRAWFGNRIPLKLIASFLFFVAGLFYFLWLKEIVPAIAQRKFLSSLVETGLLTNPVHVLDLSVFLPAIIFASILLLRRDHRGFVLVPILLVFCTEMDINIGSLIILMHAKGIMTDLSVAIIMGLLALINMLFLYLFFKKSPGMDRSYVNPDFN